MGLGSLTEDFFIQWLTAMMSLGCNLVNGATFSCTKNQLAPLACGCKTQGYCTRPRLEQNLINRRTFYRSRHELIFIFKNGTAPQPAKPEFVLCLTERGLDLFAPQVWRWFLPILAIMNLKAFA